MGWLPDWLTGQGKRDAEAAEAARLKLERKTAIYAMQDAELARAAGNQAAPIQRVEGQLRPGERLFPDQIDRQRDMHDNPRMPGLSDIEREASRLELTRTPQPAPTIAGPGMTFVNPRTKPPRAPGLDLADSLLEAGKEFLDKKEPAPTLDTSPSIFPDYSKGMELRDDQKGKKGNDQAS